MTETVIIFNDSNVKSTGEMHTLVRRCCKAALRTEGMQGLYEISVTFTDDEGIRAINKEFRDLDQPTDVLSFPMSDDKEFEKNLDTGAFVIGDIVINLEQAKRQSEQYGHSFNREVGFLCVHSVFHLLGYDHMTGEGDAALMRQKEEVTLESLGLVRL